MQRYFVSEEYIDISKNVITIEGNDFHHIKNVMRMKINDEVFVCNNLGDSFLCKIILFTNYSVILSICNKLEEKTEIPVIITIAQGLIKREKTEEVIEKITELGASYYLPVLMERSIVRIKENINNKVIRYNIISKEASEQSHRTKMLEVLNPIDLNELLKISKNYDLCIYAYEESGRNKNQRLKQLLKENINKNILVLVGPEGGISLKEVELLNKSGFEAVGLGPRILRTETAPIYIMSAISYEFEL